MPSEVGSAVAGQNASMPGFLMARHGGPVLDGGALGALPRYLSDARAAIFAGMPR